jgi:hypothetical protein
MWLPPKIRSYKLLLPFSVRKVAVFTRVDQVPAGRPGFTGQLPGEFLPRPGPVSSPGRPGPGSTHWAGPGFKTMV